VSAVLKCSRADEHRLIGALLAEAMTAARPRKQRMQFEPRISLITLGVADVPAATRFYETIGLRRHEGQSTGEVSFFDLGGLVLAVFGRDALAHDTGSNGFSGQSAITLAYNTRSDLEVDKLVAAFVVAGGSLVRAPERAPWGGYSGYVADPDGHLWEIAHNPHWTLGEDGRVALPE
jgi:uncharacterized protein